MNPHSFESYIYFYLLSFEPKGISGRGAAKDENSDDRIWRGHEDMLFPLFDIIDLLQMRYIMKGGVWKNSQDQILKAAIMKYGLNQWSRISSLLQRKSAKQCKQRWYEWLDPSIKKTEWTRAEDQKLLQLARVFPSQWRTIAPFVGRTPTQCYERYQKLLDMAQGKSLKDAEDLRRLRPGQIDPNPETKPARLDPIDMDEDEKEMLAEVRVRLANTKGKKAKRKEREKIIEEARRLAQLQKIRELEMAGVENIPTAKEIKRLRQKQDIDYTKEIPFKREVPNFVYHTEESQTPKNVGFASTITLQTLEGKRRDVEEELQRKLDRRRMKKLRERDLKTVIEKKNDIRRPTSLPISLPEPQINEQDLESMKKYNITTPLQSLQADASYGMTPTSKILHAARVNYSLNHREMTPLNEEGEDDGLQALNYLKELEKNKANPTRSIDRVISERMKTPLNEWEEESRKLKKLFKGLKKPQNQIEFEIPEEEEEEEEEVILDAEEVEKEQRKKNIIAEEERLKLETSVIRKKLPRPRRIPHALASFDQVSASDLIQKEILSLIYSDGIDNPLDGIEFPNQLPEYKQYISFDRLEQARQLVAQELPHVLKELAFDEEQFSLAKKHVKMDYGKKEAKIVSNEVKNQEQTEEYEQYRVNLEQYILLGKKADGNEKKVKKLLGGYERLIRNKFEELNNYSRELEKLRNERGTLEAMALKERSSGESRISELEEYYRVVYKSL